MKQNRPIIETIINTCALALTASGTTMLMAKEWWGFLLISFGAGLEYYKYWGRNKKLW
ncbi:hypothetical protein LCGC14_2861900 [marine sediment metagenome]|uniref:Uncharacterized protein n=1 Tax=marine sediment metagenome TaxID=412755 RepID=A0A0F9AWK4_9ZZZZ